jgi:hypothetical protein
LERKDLVDPFGQTFLLREQKGEKSRTRYVPMDGVEDGWVGPLMVLAQVRALLLANIEASDLGRAWCVSVAPSMDNETSLVGRKGTVGAWSTSARVSVAMASHQMLS